MKSLADTNEIREEVDKLSFISSCAINCVQEGGSVLIPLTRLGIVFQLIEQMSLLLESSCLKVLFFCYLLHTDKCKETHIHFVSVRSVKPTIHLYIPWCDKVV